MVVVYINVLNANADQRKYKDEIVNVAVHSKEFVNLLFIFTSEKEMSNTQTFRKQILQRETRDRKLKLYEDICRKNLVAYTEAYANSVLGYYLN